MSDTTDRILRSIDAGTPGRVWVPTDFADIGSRSLIDKTLQRLVTRGELRRIDRGLYDRPTLNSLTKRPASPDYRAVIDALARRDQARILVDGMTAANDLGLTDAVPAQVTIYTDSRRRSIQLDNLLIQFKQAAPSRLYWASRPAMRIVQALHWLKDMLPGEGNRVRKVLLRLLADPQHGAAIRADLADGFSVLPGWMQEFLRSLPGFDLAHRNSALASVEAPERPARKRSTKEARHESSL